MPSLSELQRQALLEELSGLRRFALSLTGEMADADDLLQATVERVLQKGMPEDAHVGKWTYRVCKNLWIDELRSREVRQRSPHMLTAVQVDEAPSAEHIASDEREMAGVTRALNKLPTDQRLALGLVAIDGRTYAEAADILEVPIGTIMSRISRARRFLVETYGSWEEL